MKGIIDVLQEEVKQAFEKAGYDGKYAKVTISNRPDLCQYQCNGALAMAKEYHKAPIQMAEQIVELLKQSDTFAGNCGTGTWIYQYDSQWRIFGSVY